MNPSSPHRHGNPRRSPKSHRTGKGSRRSTVHPHHGHSRSIRPVCRSFPTTQTVWDDTNLPFGVTLTPHMQDDDDDDNDTGNDRHHNDSHTSNTHTHSPPPRHCWEDTTRLGHLHTIPKCLRCGAPHASPSTHGRPAKGIFGPSAVLVCYLCGHTSVTSVPDTRQRRRRPSEHLHPRTTGHHRNHNHHAAVTAAAATLEEDEQETDTEEDAERPLHDPDIFELPLRLGPQPTPPHSPPPPPTPQHSPPPPCYSLPALACPDVWCLVLDGSCVRPQYWHTVAESLQQCLDTAPPHTHVCLLVTSTIVSTTTTTTTSPSNGNGGSRLPNGSGSGGGSSGGGGGSGSSGSMEGVDGMAPHQPQPQPQQNGTAAATAIVEPTASVFDLTSPVPHVVDYPDGDDLIEALVRSIVPIDTPHVRTAIRSLWDYPSVLTDSQQSRPSTQTASQSSSSSSGCPLAWSLEVLLAALGLAVAAGQRHRSADAVAPPSPSSSSSPPPLLRYAGAKCTVLLADRPAGLSTQWLRNHRRDTPGEKWSAAAATVRTRAAAESGDSEVTPRALQDRYQPWSTHVCDDYAALGERCAQAAVGVDLICLYDDTPSVYDTPNANPTPMLDVPDFALPLVSLLPWRSGAPGPALLPWTDPTAVTHEVRSRTPWQPGRVFGAELRVRVSPGVAVDPSRTTTQGSLGGWADGPPLAQSYATDGLSGPASAVGESTQLWRMGTTDPHTSYTLDLVCTRTAAAVPDHGYSENYGMDHHHHSNNHNHKAALTNAVAFVEGIGPVAMPCVLQTCFAYTVIVPRRDAATGQVTYHTVRRMRIASRTVPLADTAESLYATLDTEALCVVLYHKLALAAFGEGLKETADMANQWLQLLLGCVYRSAQEQWERQRMNEEARLVDSSRAAHYFYAAERLLDSPDGELSAEDVLLAQGHERLRPIPLMIYLLLQCDGLRYIIPIPHFQSTFSMDQRIVSLFSMGCATPGTLTRCIAPRLQLWESGTSVQEPIVDVLDLRSEAIQSALLEEYSRSGSTDLILLLDTPSHIVVMDARYVNSDADDDSVSSGGMSSPMRRSTIPPQPLVVGPGLRQAIEDAAASYRTRPAIVYELDQSATSGDQTFLRLMDVLMEDTANVATQTESFAEYKAVQSHRVQTALEKEL